MLREPSKKNQPSVFQFEAYPGPSDIYHWNAQDPKYTHPIAQLPSSSPLFSNLVQTPQIIPSPVAPQVPSSFCFGNSSINAGQFPFQISHHGFPEQQQVRLTLGKRKTDSPPLQPYKQHITEEKMAEHMSRLHISSETAVSPLEPESVKNKRLYMCEEMRKLQTEPLLPDGLFTPIERPCTALVLWQPPARALPVLNTESESTTNNKEGLIEDTMDAPTRELLELVMDSEFGGSMDLDS